MCAEGNVKLRQSPESDKIAKQIISMWPGDEPKKMSKHNDVTVTAFRFRHTNPRNYQIQNLGFVIQLGDKKILHLGDAEARSEHFEHLDLASLGIDAAILPVWFFQKSSLITKQIAARHLIAAHIATAQAEQIKTSFAKKHPGVFVPTKAMQTWQIPD